MENTNRLATGSLIQLSCAWFSGGWLLFSCMANTKLVHNFLFNLMLVVGGVCASQAGGQAQWRYASVISSAALDATTDLGSSMQKIQIATAKRTITLIGNTYNLCLSMALKCVHREHPSMPNCIPTWSMLCMTCQRWRTSSTQSLLKTAITLGGLTPLKVFLDQLLWSLFGFLKCPVFCQRKVTLVIHFLSSQTYS